MSILKRTLAGGLAVVAFAGAMTSFTPSAQAYWRNDGWRANAWRARDYRYNQWRAHRWGAPYYYGARTYYRPPIVYGPPPPSPGIGLFFNIR
jgi:hypothetical protein